MLKLLSFVWIIEEYTYTIDCLLEDLDCYNTPCHIEVGKSRVPKVHRSNSKPVTLIGKYTLSNLLELIDPQTQHEEVNIGPSVGNEIW